MFNQAQKSEYTAIKAPANIKRRVDATLIRRQVAMGRLGAMAACLALIATVTVFSFQRFLPKTVALSYMGAPITAQQVTVTGGAEEAVAFGAKTIVPSGIPLQIQAGRNTKVSVSDGRILIFGRGESLEFVGTELTLDASAEIRWDVSGLPGGCYTLSVAEQVYEVCIDAENGTMLIYKK